MLEMTISNLPSVAFTPKQVSQAIELVTQIPLDSQSSITLSTVSNFVKQRVL